MANGDMLPEYERSNFKSMADQTWRDLQNNEHKQFIVRSSSSGGHQIINTFNGVEDVVLDNFSTKAAAQDYLRKHPQR
jgi:hypothetical protein